MSNIIRSKKEANYSVLDNTFIQDERLSWKQKGLMCYILSLPDDWKLNLADLSKRSASGRDATASTLKSLIEYGYVSRTQVKNNGKYAGYDYIVYEKPYTENQYTENTNTEKPTLVNTNQQSTKKVNTNKDINLFFEELWKLYPNKKGKAQISDTKKKQLYKHKDQLKQALARYIDYVNGEEWLKFQNGSTWFNSGYVDYLDENYTEPVNLDARISELMIKTINYDDIPSEDKQNITREMWYNKLNG